MGKIKNLILFSEQFNIDRGTLSAMGIFNPILNLDTPLFIDPILLKSSKHKIIKEDAINEYNNFFSNIISLLYNSKQISDFAWRSALNLFSEKEIDGTCLGYGTNSTSGRGISNKVKDTILITAKEIINLGIKDPELFSILPLFNKGIGPDTISDMTTKAIHKSLLIFSAEKAKILNIQTKKIEIYGEEWDAIPNPLRKQSHILLLPNDILRNLPIVRKWEDIDAAATFNRNLRNRVNKYLSPIFKNSKKINKADYIRDLMGDKEFMSNLIETIKGCQGKAYNQDVDNDRIVILGAVKEIINPEISDNKSFDKSQEGLDNLVSTIIEKFKFLIEEKGLNKLLWKDDKSKRCKENVAQLIFFAVALTYCQANDIDVSPELDTGTGLIDFKFSVGYNKKNIVEIKYSDNSSLINGYSKQLEQYKKSEETNSGMYVILDVGKMGRKQKQLERLYNESQIKSEIFYIDSRLKKSASKL